jgi:carbonic anhydrase/acetyltransferase-like protein (isoleucine patch superfamily)
MKGIWFKVAQPTRPGQTTVWHPGLRAALVLAFIMAPTILPFDGAAPRIDPAATIMDTAVLVGDVALEAESSVWFQTVLRADIYPIRIGRQTNIQDHCTVHVYGGRFATTIGHRVTVGHGAVLHGCTIEDDCLIGIGAVILDGAVIGRGSLVGAAALITPGTRIPAGSMVLGSPARAVRPVTDAETERIRDAAPFYAALAAAYREKA